MKVRVLKQHYNEFGKSYQKKVGEVYDHPDPELLIKRKKVEDAEKPKAAPRSTSGVASSTTSTAKP